MLCCWSFLSLSLSLSHTHIHTYIHTGTKLLIPVSIRKPCNCKKSKCLKLYCECFAARMYCVGCNCADCNNNSKHDEIRNDAIKAVLERNPKAFDAKIQGKKGAKAKKHSKGYVLSLSLSLSFQHNLPNTHFKKIKNQMSLQKKWLQEKILRVFSSWYPLCGKM